MISAIFFNYKYQLEVSFLTYNVILGLVYTNTINNTFLTDDGITYTETLRKERKRCEETAITKTPLKAEKTFKNFIQTQSCKQSIQIYFTVNGLFNGLYLGVV